VLPQSRRLAAIATAPPLLTVLVLTAFGAIPVFAGVVTGGLIALSCGWLARRMERQSQFTLLSNQHTTAGVEQRVLDAFAEPVIILDDERTVLLANAAAQKVFGATHPGRDISVSIRHPVILDCVDTALAGHDVEPIEVSLHGNVPLTFVAHVAEITATAEDDHRRVVIFLQDVTALKRAEAVRADFVANVSHELRSPLAALVGFIETLQGPARGDAEAQERFLNIMRSESERMTRLIEDLLSLSSVESNEHVRPDQEVDLESVIRGVLDTLSTQLNEQGNQVDFSVEHRSTNILGDRDELTQVFQNLLDNAIKYGGPNQIIRVRISLVERIPESGDRGISVEITDQGDGIDPDHLPRLTERFYRVDKGRSRSLGGTGLGLAIVKHIVSRHRGHFAVDSTVGEGTTCKVLLPTLETNNDVISNA